MVSSVQETFQALANLGALETPLAGMTLAWCTAGLAAVTLGVILYREIRRRQRRIRPPTDRAYPAPQPKLVLRLPRRDARS
tara:strand:- start:191 stop:433 length:243 start_codon:yes stop_codon:yes gene_type:complete